MMNLVSFSPASHSMGCRASTALQKVDLEPFFLELIWNIFSSFAGVISTVPNGAPD